MRVIRLDATLPPATLPPEIANAQFIQAAVLGPGNVNRLLIFTGTAILEFDGPKEADGVAANEVHLEIILSKSFSFAVPKGIPWTATYVAIASESSDANDGANDECTFAIVQNLSTSLDGDQVLKLTTVLQVGIDSHLHRIAYQANVLAHAD